MKLLDNGNAAFSKADGTIVMMEKGFCLMDKATIFKPLVIATHGFKVNGLPEIEFIDIEKLLVEVWNKIDKNSKEDVDAYSYRFGFIQGYNKRAETHLFTLEQMEKAIDKAINIGLHQEYDLIKDIIPSVQVPEYLEFETIEVEDYVGGSGHSGYPTFHRELKSTNGKIIPVQIQY